MLPALFDGDWDTALIVTYGADLEFYERDLLRQLPRTRNRVILADARQVTRKFADPDQRSQLRQVNRSYVLAPLQVDRAAHAKLIMLLSDDRGLLAVGSGNLGMSGYASQGECFTTYSWTDGDGAQLQEFLAARSFVDELCERRLVDTIARTRIKQAWGNAPWLYNSGSESPPRVRHNLDTGLLDQFIEALDGENVDELVVHAPFYDHRCQALAELIERTAPQQLVLLLQERVTSVDPKRLSAVLANAPGSVDVHTVQAEDTGTFLHAKFLIARCGKVAICLQGSPNISTPALSHAYPDGNIELANLLVGKRCDFDHLVSNLVLSPHPVEVSALGLGLTMDDDADETNDSRKPGPEELAWIPPNLSGLFAGEVRVAPLLLVDDTPVDDVTWSLTEPSAGTTPFSASLGPDSAAALNGVAAVGFVFESGEESAPAFPYHVNALMALASGHGRTDLLKQAGDFDLDDEELEELLAQLDELLVVDGRSIWRMLKRKEPPVDEDGPSSIAYDDLDWDAIQSHPKLAQYRDWKPGSDPTALGVLLASIAERFEADVQRGRAGADAIDDFGVPSDSLEDLAAAIEAEDEEAAEEAEAEREHRRLTARSRARRQFHSFVQRFVDGLTDEEFVRHVGPSVIVPSYVVFNHLCWKLIQVDLADPLRIVEAQTTLWRFFWGQADEPGYLAGLSTGEQLAALEILERHHSQAVLLCSLFQAYDHTWRELDDQPLLQVRDAWRGVLVHPLWQPTRPALSDSATLLRHECESAQVLVEELDGLASYIADDEPFSAVGRIIGSSTEAVSGTTGRVNRGSLGARDVTIYVIEDPDATLTPEAASSTFSALAALLPDADYLRLEDRTHDVVAFADYELDDFVYANRAAGDIEDLARPAAEFLAWRDPLDRLHEMADAESAA